MVVFHHSSWGISSEPHVPMTRTYSKQTKFTGRIEDLPGTEWATSQGGSFHGAGSVFHSKKGITGEGRHAWSPRVHFSDIFPKIWHDQRRTKVMEHCACAVKWAPLRRNSFRSGQTLSPAHKFTRVPPGFQCYHLLFGTVLFKTFTDKIGQDVHRWCLQKLPSLQ